jgi:Arc/MetJ-type ribon-helix-helix transcriptional regulator
METVSVKLEESFARDMERLMQKHRYATKTEFIREAIRDKLRQLELQERLALVDRMYGASKRKTTDKQLHKAREKAGRGLERAFGLK